MYYYADLKVFIENPEQHSKRIADIIAAAAHADSTIKSFLLVLANPMNGEMWLANPARFINDQINILWSAATLMLAIPQFKTKEHVELSLKYLRLAAYEHHLPAAFNSLGWCYSKGIEGYLEKDFPQALLNFEKAHGTSNWDRNWNSVAWCYEELGDFHKAANYWKKTLKNLPENEPAIKHLKICLDKITERKKQIKALMQGGIFANNNSNFSVNRLKRSCSTSDLILQDKKQKVGLRF